MHIAHKTWPELKGYFDHNSLALVPLGSTEQHGPHLPLATDYVIAESFAREAANRTGYICTPTINIGVSPHHKQFHGTMWVEPPVFRKYVESITRNLAYHGIDRIIYINAHGGNVEHLREVGRRLRDDGVIYAIEWMWNNSIPELVDNLFEQTGPHGGPKETALMQHIAGELVKETRLEDARDGGLVDLENDNSLQRYGAQTFYDTIDVTENGVLGDQTDVTAEKGEKLFDAAVEKLIQLCEWINSKNFNDLMPKDHM